MLYLGTESNYKTIDLYQINETMYTEEATKAYFLERFIDMLL